MTRNAKNTPIFTSWPTEESRVANMFRSFLNEVKKNGEKKDFLLSIGSQYYIQTDVASVPQSIQHEKIPTVIVDFVAQ